MTKKEKSIYMAGFFDGEGYIGLLKRVRKEKYLEYFIQLSIGQNDGAIVDWIKENFGGNCYLVKRDNSFYWTASNRNAYNILKEITPFLKYKKPQAELALKYFDEQLPRKQGLSEDEFKRRESIYLGLKHLKKVFTESTYCNEKIRVQRLNESDSEKSM